MRLRVPSLAVLLVAALALPVAGLAAAGVLAIPDPAGDDGAANSADSADSAPLLEDDQRYLPDAGQILAPPDTPRGMPFTRSPVPAHPLSRSSSYAPPSGTGDKRMLVLPVRFADVNSSADRNESALQRIFLDRGNAGSLARYFDEASLGKLNLSGDVASWVTVAGNSSTYGADGPCWYDPSRACRDGTNGPLYRLVTEAVLLADGVVNFSDYDDNGDGVVDNLIVVHAGSAQEQTFSTNDIWSQHWWVDDADLNTSGHQQLIVDGVQVHGFGMVGEHSPMGIAAHEYVHEFAIPGKSLPFFPDLYDLDGSSLGIGVWDLMAAGAWTGGGWSPAHPSAWTKAMLGWIVPTIVPETRANITLPSVETGGQVLKLPIGGTVSPEYFILENRQRRGFDRALPGDGILIWHIDDRLETNRDDHHRWVDLEEADEGTNGDSAYQGTDPWANSTDGFNALSVPDSNAYDGSRSLWAIRNIGTSGGSMKLDVVRADDDLGILDLRVPRVTPQSTPVPVNLTIQNGGTRTASGASLKIEILDRETVVASFSRPVDLAVGAELPVNWTWAGGAAGDYVLTARITFAADDIQENNLWIEGITLTKILFADDVESGTDGWIASSTVPGPSLWHISTSAARSPVHSWAATTEPGGPLPTSPLAEYILESRPIDAPRGELVALVFSHRYDLTTDLENQTGLSDRGTVEVSANNGPWTVITAYTGQQSSWRAERIDLTPYLTLPALNSIRIRFTVTQSAPATGRGWWLDDFQVASGLPAVDFDLKATPRFAIAHPGTPIDLNMSVSNVGLAGDSYDLSFKAPPSWKVVFPAPTVGVAARSATSYSVAVTPAATVAGGTTADVWLLATSRTATTLKRVAIVVLFMESIAGFRLEAPDAVNATPGIPTTFLLAVNSTGNIPDTLELHLTGTGAAIAGVASPRVDLPAFANITIPVTVTIPAGTRAGTQFPLTIGVNSTAATGFRREIGITLRTARVRDVAAVLEQNPVPIVPGRTGNIVINITNRGNAVEALHLTAIAPVRWGANVSSDLSLPPDGTGRLSLLLSPPKNASVETYDVALTIEGDAGFAKTLTVDVLLVVPDLLLERFRPERTNYHVDEDVNLTVRVRNQGTGPASGVTLRLFDGTDPLAEDVLEDPIAAGGSVNHTFSVRLKPGARELRLQVFIDSAESDVSNNEASVDVLVSQPSVGPRFQAGLLTAAVIGFVVFMVFVLLIFQLGRSRRREEDAARAAAAEQQTREESQDDEAEDEQEAESMSDTGAPPNGTPEAAAEPADVDGEDPDSGAPGPGNAD